MQTGWDDGTWANTYNIANTNPVHSGTKSISWTPNTWDVCIRYSGGGGGFEIRVRVARGNRHGR